MLQLPERASKPPLSVIAVPLTTSCLVLALVARTAANVPLAEEPCGSPTDNEATGMLTVPDESRTVEA